jgi:F-type H+-transporting ATPase subunit b
VELSWTTFILEAINFLVLVWVLKRLFYAPVKRAIAQRRAAVEKTLHDAESTSREAEDLKSKYDGRLKEWEVEKERQRGELRKELSEERARQLKSIEAAVAAERERMEVQEQVKSAERRANDQAKAMKQALEFTSRLLHDLASPELEAKIGELLTQQISAARPEDFSLAGAPAGNGHRGVEIRSAFALGTPQRDALIAALKLKLGNDISVRFEQDPQLLAGLEVAMGSYVWRANLRDELAYFAGMGRHES